jgi:hypothetical protein
MAECRKGLIKCIQINLKHSREATDNLMQIITTKIIIIMLVQEPYFYQEEIREVSRKYRTYSYGEGRRRAAIMLANNNVDSLLVTEHPNKDTVLLEIHQKNDKYYAASMYMDYNATIDVDLKRIEENTFTKEEKRLKATDSKCSSTAWHNTTTNNRGRMMDVFVASTS